MTAVDPLSAVDPDGFPSHVVTDELIESAWGNAVVDNLHRISDQAAANAGQIVAAKPQGYRGFRTTNDLTPVGVFGTVTTVTVNPAAAGTWLIAATGMVSAGANDVVVATLKDNGTDVGQWISNFDVLANKRDSLTIVSTVVVDTPASHTFSMLAYGASAQLNLLAGSQIAATYLGLHL